MKDKKQYLKLAINAVPLAPGGGLVGLISCLKAWQELNLKLKITVYASRNSVITAVHDNFPDIEIIPFARGKNSSAHFFLQQTQLGPIISKGNYDVLMTTQYGLRKCGIPQLIHHQNLKRFEHSSILTNLKNGKALNFIKDYASRISMLHADCNVFISNYIKKEAQNKVSGPKSKNFVVYNGLANNLLCKKNNIEHIKKKSSDLIAIQDTSKHKDNKTLIRTLANLCEKRPDVNWHLHIAGAGDWSAIKESAIKLNVINKITFHGFLTENRLNELLKKALCLIFTSRIEGFGNPPLEAMAMGCPVVACNCTAMPEVIGNAGILVEPGNYLAFSNSIVDLIEDDNLRLQLIQNGYARIQKFNWQTSAMKMYSLLKEISIKGKK